MRRLLLISNSTLHGSGYLQHCEEQLTAFLTGIRRVLFVPFALHDRDGYAAQAAKRYRDFGIEVESLHAASNPREAVNGADAVFTGGGNTFRLLRELYRTETLEPLRARIAAGMPYVGTSAGSNIACPTIRTTNDMPIVQPPSFKAIDAVPFQINAHFLDADPGSKHMGETRETRLEEFLEENDTSVVGLREGAMLHIEGDSMTLRGSTGARVFGRGHAPREVSPGTDMSHLL